MRSWTEERDEIFRRWLREVEQRVGRPAEPKPAFDAWTDGYTASGVCGSGCNSPAKGRRGIS